MRTSRLRHEMFCRRTKYIPLHVVRHIMKTYLRNLGFSKYEINSMNAVLPVIIYAIMNNIIIIKL